MKGQSGKTNGVRFYYRAPFHLEQSNTQRQRVKDGSQGCGRESGFNGARAPVLEDEDFQSRPGLCGEGP